MYLSVFQILLFAHLLGDFVFQTNKIAYLKSHSKLGVYYHGAIVLVSNVLVLFLCNIRLMLLPLLISISHLIIDKIKNRFQSTFKGKESLLFLIDQLLHIIVLKLAVKVFSMLPSYVMLQVDLILLSKIIILSYVSTVFCVLIIKDLYPSEKKNEFFRSGERLIEMFFSILLFIIITSKYKMSWIFVIGISLVFFMIERNYLKYEAKTIYLKSFVIMIFQISMICI